MQSNKIRKILKKYKEAFEALENYDKTRELPFQKKKNRHNFICRDYK